MPRPDKETKKRIEARRRSNQVGRDDAAAREKQAAARVQKIISSALDRPRMRDTLPDLHNLIEKLESAFDLAMASGQAKSAVDATMAMGRLLGLVVDKSAIAVADFRTPQTREDVINDLRESIGDGPTQQFLDMVEEFRRRYKGDGVIEGSARRLNGSAHGADND